MLLDEIAAYLEGQNVGTRATDLFTGFMPDTPDEVVVVYENPGMPPSRSHSDSPNLEHPQIGVWARGTVDGDYAGPRQKAQDAYNALVLIRNQTLSATLYLDVMPMQQPFLLERDDNKRAIIGFNAAVTKVP